MKVFATILMIGISAHAAFGQDLLNKVKNKATSAESSATSEAKSETNKATSTAQKSKPSLPSLSDLSGSKDAIMAKLAPAMSLTETQKPAVTSAIEGFLKKKAAIAPLATTDKKSYDSKFGPLKSGLLSSIKKAVTAGQYAKFLKLKPKTPDATNVLSNLFY